MNTLPTKSNLRDSSVKKMKLQSNNVVESEQLTTTKNNIKEWNATNNKLNLEAEGQLDHLNEMKKVKNSNNSNKEDIWFNNIFILFEPDKLVSIVPTKEMSLGGKINAVTRFTLYLSILLTVLKANYLYIYVFIVPVIISYAMYIFSSKKKEYFANLNEENSDINSELTDQDLNNIMENALNDECKKPTTNNPAMNLMLSDNFQTVKPACNISDPNISRVVSNEITDSLSEKIYNDTTSIINSKVNERTFYTMPNTSVPNDQGAFVKWLYNTPVSCETGNDGLLKQMRSCAFTNKPLSELNKELNNNL